MLLGTLIGPRNPDYVKSTPFECGLPSKGSVGQRYSVRFFLVAVLFLLFDVEAVFLFPWATIFREFVSQGYGLYMLSTMGFFLFIIILGFVYEWKKGTMEWE